MIELIDSWDEINVIESYTSLSGENLSLTKVEFEGSLNTLTPVAAFN